MHEVYEQKMLEGIYYVINEHGEKTAVQIDLRKYGELWEDFFDTINASERANEPRESLESVMKRLVEIGKLNE